MSFTERVGQFCAVAGRADSASADSATADPISALASRMKFPQARL
jgi:hypothetical protein